MAHQPYETTVNAIASMVAVMLFLTNTTLALRFTARTKQKASFGKDDWLAAMACFMFLGSNIVAIYGMVEGWMGFSSPKNNAAYLAYIDRPQTQSLLAGQVCALWTLGFSRISAVFFYRRIFCTGRGEIFDFLTKAIICIISLWAIGFTLSTLLACGPDISVYWSNHSGVSCVSYPNQKGNAVSSFLLDFLVLILPLPQIWSLHTTKTRKIAISAVFLVALSGLIASCTRMVIVFEIVNRGPAVNALDPFGINTQQYFYQLLEQGACLTAVNLPSVWYFLHDLTPERVLRSVRSIVSLKSTSSQESTGKSNSGISQNGSMDSTSGHEIPSKRATIEFGNEK